MNCTDVRKHLDGLLPGDAPDPAIPLHLARCAACRAHADALALVDARLGALHAGVELPDDFMARLSARLAREAQARPRVERAAVERELDGWLARLRRETLAEAAGIAAGGVAFAAAAWTLAPETGAWLARASTLEGLLVLGGVTMAATLAGAWVAMGGTWRTLLARAG
jgi:hypothetical protein